MFVIPDRRSKFSDTKFRKEIKDTKDMNIEMIDGVERGFDIDEIESFTVENIKQISQQILDKTDESGVTLFVARKLIKFEKEFNQEIKYKKFLLLNVILGLSVLSEGGNFVIKIYDMFTHFTVSLIYILYNLFESLTIVKPFSTRPHSGCRYVICQKLNEPRPQILNYLYDFYDRYIELLKDGQVNLDIHCRM